MSTQDETDYKQYDLHDEVWKNHGLAAPARKALVNAGIYNEKHLRMHTVEELKALHGIGKKALEQLEAILHSSD
jgi:hypothetical protein